MVDDTMASGKRPWNTTIFGSVRKFFNPRPKNVGRAPPVGELTEYSSLATAPIPDVSTNRGLRQNSAKLGWRPATLKPLFLICFAILTAILIVVLEIMLQISQKNGALAFVSDKTTFIDHVFSFGPLLFGVVYGLLYASVDHDLKRLEAYFQLSKPEGVSVDHSLLLGYPYMLAVTVPYFSLRKKHWAVFCSSLALAFCMFGVAPLTGIIFSKQFNIERSEAIMLRPVNPLGNVPQDDATKAAFAYKAYSHLYSNGTLPPFTTESFAVMPFAPVQDTAPRKGEQWVAKTSLLEAELDCSLGIIDRTKYISIRNAENDCSLSWSGTIETSDLKNTTYSSFMIDKDYLKGFNVLFTMPPFITFNCSRNDTVVGYWGKQNGAANVKTGSSPSSGPETVVFCRPVHRIQEVTVTVDPTGRIFSSPTTDAPKLYYNDFNLTQWKRLALGYEGLKLFQRTLVDKYPIDGLDLLGQGLPDHTSQLIKRPMFQQPSTDKTNGTKQINVNLALRRSFTPFGLARQENLDDLLDPNKLSRMFSDSYKYLFAMAAGASGLIVPDRSNLPQFEGRRKYVVAGYVLDNIWTRVLEGCLGMVIILNFLLVSLLWNRRCAIDSDPGTLASIMASVDQAVLDDFHDAEFLGEKGLLKQLINIKHKYYLHEGKVEVVGKVESGGETQLDSEEPAAASTEIPVNSEPDRTKIEISKPWDLAIYMGIGSSLIMLGTIILLICIYSISIRDRGFVKPLKKLSYDIYSSYVPMIVSMIFEAYLVLLTSHVTYLWPFKRLLRGNSTAKPLTFNYDKTPPHLQMFCGFKTRNYLLAALSTSVLLANILAVAIGGLFQVELLGHSAQGPVLLNGTVESLNSLNSNKTFLKDSQFIDSEFMYTAVGDGLGFGAQHWTTDDLYYIPFQDNSNKQNARTNYSAVTSGIGLNITCEEAPITLWTSPVARYNKSEPLQTITFPTLAENKNASLLLTNLAGGMIRWIDGGFTRLQNLVLPGSLDPLAQHAFLFYNKLPPVGINITWNDPNSVAFFELGPKQYSPESKENWEFYQSWVKYNFTKRVVTIDRPLLTQNKSYVVDDLPLLGKTVNVDNALPEVNAIRCRLGPRIVQASVTVSSANTTGNILQTDQVQEQPIDDSQLQDTGITGLVNAFKEMVYRDSATSSVTSILLDRTAPKSNSLPRTWISFLIQQECRSLYPDFSVFVNPQRNAKCTERVYKKLFATYVQLHSGAIFPPEKQSAEKAPSAQAHFIYEEQRVIMRPVAFWVSVVMLVLFLPVVGWTYISLFNGFLTHEPTSLAGTYAAFYASDVLEDVKGMHLMREKERKEALLKKGGLYRYGWFTGGDGKTHFGIARDMGEETMLRQGE
ncbi:hypothetical protein BZA77DRAFT_318896 [Pyronema omphalodes]|nr:hypothetical protein BZA77DRAFT_318896 [Pyronema omphalodes]